MRHLPRYARLFGRVVLSNARRLASPYKLNFAVTDRCNSRCVTCGIWRKPVGNELSIDEIRAFFGRSRGFSWIDLTGGEVFLRPDIVEICSAILENCRGLLLLHYPTNGILTGRIVARTREILALRPPRLVISVSLDGPPAVNDRIRGVPGDWAKAVETFRRLRELRGAEVYLGMTLSAHNHGLVRETYESVRQTLPDAAPHEFHVNIMHTSAHYYANEEAAAPGKGDILRDLAEYAELRPRRLTAFGCLERAYQDRIPRFLETGRSPLRCSALSASCFLGPRGDVYPCSIWDRPLGNIRDHDYDLAAIWKSAAAVEARRCVIDENCPGCWTPCEAYQTVAANLLRR